MEQTANYIEIRITARRELEDVLSDAMFAAGAEGLEILDNEPIVAHLDAGDWDASVYDDMDRSELPTERITLRTLLADDAEGREAAAAMLALCGEFPDVEGAQTLIPAVDWQEKWKQGFAGRPVGERLWLRPNWDESPVPSDRIDLVIDPGMAFGTGEHPTTEMILSLLESHVWEGCSVLDLGCGSGILGIAARLLGAGSVRGVDIDPVCEEAVARHLEINHLAAADFLYRTGDVLADDGLRLQLASEPAELVVANITASVLSALAPYFGSMLAEGGTLLCSGILERFEADVAASLAAAGFVIRKRTQDGEWVALTCARA